MNVFLDQEEINNIPQTHSEGKENIQSPEGYNLIQTRNELLIKHNELLIAHKKDIVKKIDFYIKFIIAVFCIIAGGILINLVFYSLTVEAFLQFIKDCPYFLLFLIALLLIPVWCITSLVKGVYKTSGNEETNLLEKMITFGKDSMN